MAASYPKTKSYHRGSNDVCEAAEQVIRDRREN